MHKVFSLLIVFFSFLSHTEAQIATNSPYSRFGLGELQQNIFPEYNAYGGASTALSSLNSINPSNPASYSYFAPKSFLLSTGGWHQITEIKNSTNKEIANNNSFSHFILGFPLSPKIGSSFGMIPFTSTGYQMTAELVDLNDPNHTALANYYGDGGLSKIYFGGAYQISSAFSVGVNASYIFGGLNRRKSLIYDDLSYFNSRSNSKINLKGYYYELGLLYKTKSSEKNEFSFGINTSNNSIIRAKKTEIVESFEFNGIIESPKDTFQNSVVWGDIVLPRYFSAGIAFNKDDRWLFIADYAIQDWADYTMFNESDNLANSMKICGGVQYTPDYNSITNYYRRMNYRFGISYKNTPLQFQGENLNELSISFGFGIPVRKSRTKYDFSCTLGKRGDINNYLVQEKFVRLGLSVSYDGIWFVKRKYD